MWLAHPAFPKVVEDAWPIMNSLYEKIKSFALAASYWNKEVFGNIFHKKARLEAKLRGIQQAMGIHLDAFLVNLEGQIKEEYLRVLNYEADFWATKSKYNWLIQGERNTTFFHTSTLVRRKRNRITCIKDNMNN